MIEKCNFSPIDGATIVAVMTDRNFVLNNPSPMYRLFVAKIFQLTETYINTLKYFLLPFNPYCSFNVPFLHILFLFQLDTLEEADETDSFASIKHQLPWKI